MFSALPHATADDGAFPGCPDGSAATLPGTRPAPQLVEIGAGDPGRDEVEAFIRDVYRRHHDAHVRHFAPRLVALRDGGRIVAAAGFRFASEPLFLERYLDEPIDVVLGRRIGDAPPRRRIVEVGHLAGAASGAGRRLILLMGPHLAARDAQWVVGTLTQELRQLFVRMGVAPMALAIADPARLGAQAQDWGRYYGHAPTVLAGHLPLALRKLERLLRR